MDPIVSICSFKRLPRDEEDQGWAQGEVVMKLVFVCPDQNKVFESDHYRVVENKGVICDAAGQRSLDAKVALDSPCPFCGKRHVYHASELSCPFGG
jgi:hypothetical protein